MKSAIRMLVLGLGILVIGPAQAATNTWDITPGTVGAGNSTVTGGSGTWNTSNGNWTLDGGTNNIAWNNANNDTALFGGTAGTVTLGEGITVGGLIFNASGYVLTGGPLTIGSTTGTVQIVNGGHVATYSGNLTGSNTLVVDTANATQLTLSGGGSFAGTVWVQNRQTGANRDGLVVGNASLLADSAAPIRLGGGVNNYGGMFAYTGASPLTFNNRWLEFNGGQYFTLSSDNATAANALTFTKPMVVNATVDGTVLLSGRNTGINAITAGGITNGPTGAVIGLTLGPAGYGGSGGNWYIGGTNGYSGATTVSSGTLTFRGKAALPSASAISIVDSATLRLLDDGSGVINYGNTFTNMVNRTPAILFVGNNGTDNGGDGAGGTTGSVISLGVFNASTSTAPGGGVNWGLNITGANGYSVRLAGMRLNTTAGDPLNSACTLNPTTASVEVTGTIQQRNGRAAGGADALVLDGTSASGTNRISGVIMNASDYPANPNAVPLNVVKSGTSTWALSGTNTYSGSTTISAGTLIIDAPDVLADNSALRLPSASTKNLVMNYNDTVGSLYLAGVQQPNGVYSSSGSASNWLSGAGILTVGSAAAYWDLDGATAGAGGATPAGTWDAANTYWNDAAGTGTAAAWTPGQTAAFAAGTNAIGTYTVTVDGTQDIGGLTFEEGDVTLSGGTALRLMSDTMAFVATNRTATLLTPLTQDATARSLTKGGPGTLVLSAANSYSGATTLIGGTLRASADGAIGYGAVSIASGSTLRLMHSNAVVQSAGIVLLGSGSSLLSDTPFSVSNLTFSFGANYTLAVTNTMNFLPGSTIACSDNSYDVTITAPITGSPAVRTKDSSGTGYQGLKFAPTSGTQTLGAVLNPDNTGTGDKAGITLAGSTTGNTVASIDYAGSDAYGDVKVQSGGWTVGNIRGGAIKLTGGTLTVNGTVTNYYTGLAAIPSGAKLAGAMSYYMNDSRFGHFTVNTNGVVAPGNPAVSNGVGTISVEFNVGQSTTGQTIFAAGSVYEWQVGPGNATDKVYVKRNSTVSNNNRSLTVQSGMVLKILEAGGTPKVTDQLPVFTYDANVTRSLGTVTFDTSALPNSWTKTGLSLVDNGIGTIYLTGLGSPLPGTLLMVY